ncbi:MAG: efflux RND transporter periplasmic adaptor subunit [Bacteroidota bacterium]
MSPHPLRVPLVCFLLCALGGCGGGDPDAIMASGTIEGTAVQVGSEVAGRVKTVRAGEGDRVEAGDTLLVVDETDYLLQLRQAEAGRDAARAQYGLSREGFRAEDIVQAEAAFENARDDLERMTDLLASQTVTQKQFDDVRTRFVAAEQTYRKLSSGLRRQEVAAAHARLRQAEASCDLLAKKVRDCVILSPARGIVTLRGVEPGEILMPGGGAMQITSLERVKLTIYLNETDIGRIRLGQRARVNIDGAPGKDFPGTVVYISPHAEFTPKNVQTREERTKLVFAVRIEVENGSGDLKPGLPADARLTPGGG